MPPIDAAPVVSISPGSANVTQGQTQRFTAAVSGTANTAVTWSLSPQIGGLIDGTYFAPLTITDPQQVQVIATSVADPSESAAATVFLTSIAVPSEYQDLYHALNTQISGFNAAINAGWNGSSYPYLDAPQLLRATSNQYTRLLGKGYYEQDVTEQLNELQALGANAVTVHMNFPILYEPSTRLPGPPVIIKRS